MIKFVAILGGGCFGTAIANVLASNGFAVKQWMRDVELVDRINEAHINDKYLPDIMLAPGLIATADMGDAVASADIIFIAIPSHSVRSVCQDLSSFILSSDKKILVSTTKGIEPNPFKLMSEVIREELPGFPIAVISGPNLAAEITTKSITGTVVASDSIQVCEEVQDIFTCDYFRVYANQDTYGVELGGALKNIYAVAAGMLSAFEFGENAKSLLITRGLAEMSRFAVALGANPLTFLGLAGVGDLIVTCSSAKSRNFQVGRALGQGRTLAEAVSALGQTAEGVNTLKVVAREAHERQIYMPIVFGLNAILFEKAAISDVLSKLMHGEHSLDVEFSSK